MPKDFFSFKKPKQIFSDIIPPKKTKKDLKPKEAERREEEIEIQQESITEVHQSHQSQELGESRSRRSRPSAGRMPRWPLILIILIAVFGGLFYLGWVVLPRLEIKISLIKYPVAFNEVIDVSKDFNLKQVNSSSTPIKLPAELFAERRNLQLSFLANGKEKIEKKAQGKITIYNSYSSDPQKLIVSTRFLTPDNKIFRLAEAITIPGAKIQEGKIIPSSIEADVIADQAGAEYNIGPIARFTIPGFKDTPKYAGFYAKSDQAMVGGFVGEVTVPTDKDISDAQTKIRQVLSDNLKTVIFSQLPKEFKVIDGSSVFTVLSEKINKEVDKDNKFSIFADAQMKLIAFRENDLKDVLTARSLSQLASGNYEVVESNIEYGAPRPNFVNGEMSFPAKGQIILERKIDTDRFRQQILSKNEIDLKSLVFSLPGLEKAQISFWPIYIKQVPNKIERIKILVQ